MDAIRSYFLIDGSMVYDVMRAQKLWLDPNADWCAPTIPGKVYRLVGPMLIDAALAKAAGAAVCAALGELIAAFPCGLHVSTIHSQADLATLSRHLGRFAAFYNQDTALLALRFADGRRLIDLAQILTPQQWGDLTSLMAHWYCHDRQGREIALNLPQDRAACGSRQVLRLSQAQISALQEVAEPDRLLRRLGYTPAMMASNMLAYWRLAKHCLEIWKASQNTDGDVLRIFARQMFASQGHALQERDWSSLLAHVTPQYLLKDDQEAGSA